MEPEQGNGLRRGTIDDVPPEWNRITEQVIGAAIEVHTLLGPGLLERHYEEAICVELRLRGLEFQRQAPISLSYKGHAIGDQCLDLIVANLLVVELKSVDRVHEVHLSQLVSYLKSSGKPLGLLLNFNVPRLKDGLFRRVLSPSTPVPLAILEGP